MINFWKKKKELEELQQQREVLQLQIEHLQKEIEEKEARIDFGSWVLAELEDVLHIDDTDAARLKFEKLQAAVKNKYSFRAGKEDFS